MKTPMKKVVPALAALLLAAVTAACATTRAQTPADKLPPLEVPPVPPRVIGPAPPLPIPQPEPVGELPTAPPAATAKPKPAPRETQKPEPKPEATVAEQPPPQPTAPTPTVPPLRTARTGDTAQAVRQIQDILHRANTMLNKVDYQKLTAERQKAYNQAKQFIEGAEAALRDGRFDYALELAEKAETFAKELQG